MRRERSELKAIDICRVTGALGASFATKSMALRAPRALQAHLEEARGPLGPWGPGGDRRLAARASPPLCWGNFCFWRY